MEEGGGQLFLLPGLSLSPRPSQLALWLIQKGGLVLSPLRRLQHWSKELWSSAHYHTPILLHNLS